MMRKGHWERPMSLLDIKKLCEEQFVIKRICTSIIKKNILLLVGT